MSKQLESILKRATSATPRPVVVQGSEATVTPLPTPAAPAAPVPTPSVEPEPTAVADTPSRAPDASSGAAHQAPAPNEEQEPAAKPKEAQKAIQAFVPASVARALNIRAAEEGVTVRTIILQGLKSIGVDVPEAELRDRRKA